MNAPGQDRLSALDAIFSAYNRGDAPGCVAAVAHEGRCVYRAAHGMAHLGPGVALTPRTRLAIGSVSKQFTCAAALLLQAEGIWSIDDPVGRWLPGLPAVQARVSLRQLMSHSSGVRDYLDVGMLSGAFTLAPGEPRATQFAFTDANFEPGRAMCYSNGGYLLLSLALERAAGQPFETLMRERVFAPLGLDDTTAAVDALRAQPGEASRYEPEADGWRLGQPLSHELYGEGNIVSTVDDLLRWAQHLRTTTGPLALREFAADTLLHGGRHSRYGLGVKSERWRGVELVQHGGTVIGGSAILLTVPAQGLDIALLANRPLPMRTLALRALDACLGSTLEPALPPPQPAAFGDLVGHDFVQPELGWMFGFADLQGTLVLTLYRFPAAPVESAATQDEGLLPFAIPTAGDPLRLRVRASDAKGVRELEVWDAGQWYLAQRIDEPAPGDEAVLAELGGDYEHESFGLSLRLQRDAQGLCAYVRGPRRSSTLRAAAVAPDLLRLWPAEVPAGVMLQVQRKGGSVAGLWLSSTRTRRLWLARRGSGRAR